MAKSSTNRLRKRMPKGLADVEQALYRALAALESGQLEPATANAMASVARSIAAIQQPAEIEARLIQLERAVDAQRKA